MAEISATLFSAPDGIEYLWLNTKYWSQPEVSAGSLLPAPHRDARGRALESTLSALQGACGKAVEILYEIMGDVTAHTSARVSAAKTVLEMMIRAHDILVNEERLRLLELRLLTLNDE